MREKIKGTIKNWENSKLGQDAEFAAQTSLEEELALDDALELKLISIRMQKSLIRKLKLIANYHGIGYQPLVRDVLSRFVGNEFLNIAKQLEAQKKVEAAAPAGSITKTRQVR